MGTCKICEKSGFFMKLYKGLCVECAQVVQSKLEAANRVIQEESPNLDLYSENVELYSVDDVVQCAAKWAISAKYIAECARKGYATNSGGFEDQLPENLENIAGIVNDSYVNEVSQTLASGDKKRAFAIADKATKFFSSVVEHESYRSYFESIENNTGQ